MTRKLHTTTMTRPRRPVPPWICAEHVAGVLLGLALAAMAVDYGYQRPSNTLPPTPTLYAP
jgi:hypothetical protein